MKNDIKIVFEIVDKVNNFTLNEVNGLKTVLGEILRFAQNDTVEGFFNGLNLRRLFSYSFFISYCLLIISCSHIFNKPTPELKEINMISFKMIKTADNSVIGYLEEAETMFINSGVENREKRKVYYLYNIDFNRLGFVTERGIYKYIEKGDVTQIFKSESYAIEFAVKKLLLYNGAIYYDDFEATPPWHDRY